jgi:putative membrane protein
VKVISTPARLGVALVLAPLVLVLTSGPALAADNVVISNTETVQAHLNPDGSVIDARVYEQLALQGNGTVVIKNPVSTSNLRNLDGFSSFVVTDGNIFTRQTVDGQQRLRTVSDYDKKLPLQVTVTYKLNGKTVEAGDVVGKSGHLEVHYKVTNVTGRDQDVTYNDGTGQMVTQTANVVIPMVGTLTTVLPSNFVDVTSAEANMAGDGRGQTQMSYTMTLFDPIGSPTSEFGYSANITKGLIPDASISALPVNPLQSPPFKGGAASYKSGAESGVQLTAGATQIDANVLKLRDGAETLIAGLIQLRDGAQKLNVGLAGDAAPGAIKLADGATQLNSGAGQLAAGADTAHAGSGVLAAGTDTLATGAGKVDAGAGQLSNAFNSPSGGQDLTGGSAALAIGVGKISVGLQELSGVEGLPKALNGLQKLRFGLDHPVHALGAADPGGLLQGLQQIAGGLSNPACNPADPTNPANPCGVKQGLASVTLGVSNPACSLANPTNPANPCGVKQIVDLVGGKLTAASATGGDIATLGSAVIGAYQQSVMAPSTPCPTSPAVPVPPVVPPSSLEAPPLNLPPTNVCVLLSEAAYGLLLPSGVPAPGDPGGLQAQTAAAGGALTLTGSGIDTKLLPGLALLTTGVNQLAAGSVSAVDAVSNKVLPGVDKLIVGITNAVTGSQILSTGALTAAAGSSDLSSGVQLAGAGASQLAAGTGALDTGAQKLASGAGQLYTGMGQLSSGATKLSDGTTQLSDGANKLAAGLGDAATGSELLAAGLITAADGGKALPAGASKLSAEGTSKLVESGRSTASDYGLKYATIVAGAQRANTEAMAYGTPANAAGTTAYAMEIAGAGGDSSGSLGRGVGGLVLFAAGAGLIVYRRMVA